MYANIWDKKAHISVHDEGPRLIPSEWKRATVEFSSCKLVATQHDACYICSENDACCMLSKSLSLSQFNLGQKKG